MFHAGLRRVSALLIQSVVIWSANGTISFVFMERRRKTRRRVVVDVSVVIASVVSTEIGQGELCGVVELLSDLKTKLLGKCSRICILVGFV